jgi:aminoglycoside/choline kinase family phosphotransferase
MVTQDAYLEPFLEKSLKSPAFKVFQLAGDASNRRYYRIVMDSQSWVLMRWDPFDPNNYPFISVQKHFAKNGVRVPEILEMSPAEGLVLLEDLGDLTLERKFWENQHQEGAMEFYQMAVDEIVKIHHPATLDKSDCTAFNIKFDTEKFLWEMNYGREHLLLGLLKCNMSDKVSSELNHIFTDICVKLDREEKRISHRDYHSRNLMIKLDQMMVIDFQDARLGPIQYDLVSLFRDSYVDMNDEMANKLISYYLDKSKSYLPSNFSRDQFNETYELQTVQRCFKACGSFSSFYNTRQDRRYLKYLNGTLKTVLKAVMQFPEYKVFADLLIDSGALDRQYDNL